MPATHLRCRNCGADVALDPVGTCVRCWGPLDPVYDLEALRPLLTRGRIAQGHQALWRYADLLAWIDERAKASGLEPLVMDPRDPRVMDIQAETVTPAQGAAEGDSEAEAEPAAEAPPPPRRRAAH